MTLSTSSLWEITGSFVSTFPLLQFEASCAMPSLQTALPPELANNAIRLYRECLRRAKYIGSKVINSITHCPYSQQEQHNTELLVGMVRQQFKKHMHETDPDRIQKLKDEIRERSTLAL
ncbi:uncharacterized protein LOC107813593 isoform X3 [Nicotiana tabacum]|uniref:Uncharacterized protein LOC107813593 isoform X3 n=1 Tax=Nicotiana tabacum TaxID=4097 RepID=A0A1S4BZN2_TOBAC|nr:PREDICTED: uncharacterized protein LOC107813593 isoform X3 [Nicotiana tabacum]